MKDLFEKLRMGSGPLARYAHLREEYFFFPKQEGDIGPHSRFNGKKVLNWSRRIIAYFVRLLSTR